MTGRHTGFAGKPPSRPGMDRRRFLLTSLGCGISALCALPADAQQAGKMVRVGLLDVGASNASSDARWKALRQRLGELGYVEGKTIAFEPRWGNGQFERLPGLADELVKRSKVDLVVTVGGEAALAMKRVTNSVPIVTATGPDPIRLGLVASLARPGGNITGVTSLNSDLTEKRLALLKQMIPRTTRVAVLRDPDNRSSEFSVEDAESKAKSLGISVQTFDAKGQEEFQAAFQAIKRAHVDAVLLSVNTPFIAHRERLAQLALSHRLPLMTPTREYAEAGALLSYGTDYLDRFRRAAGYVDKILKGAKPADLPIEQPTSFELVINLKTAKTLSLQIPPSVLAQADQVLQ